MKNENITDFVPLASVAGNAPRAVLSEPVMIDPAEIRRLMAKGRAERNAVLRAATAALFRTVGWPLTIGWKAYTKWLARRRNLRALAALDDRMLRDIGVDRGEIQSIVDGVIGYEASLANPEVRHAANDTAARRAA